MKKFALLTIPLLVLIIGVGMASATDVNDTIDDASLQAVDHQCGIEEINNSVSQIVQKDADTNIDGSVVNVVDDNINSTIDKNIDSAVTIEKSTVEPSNQKQVAKNIAGNNPKVINLDVKKQDSLKKDIAKYSEFFQKNHYKTMSNGKEFSQMDLILEIYKHYSFEDTVIIATHVLRDNGVRVTFTGVESMMWRMLDGTVYTQKDQMDASYYKDAMDKLQLSHKSLNSEIKKYSEIFNKKKGKSFVVEPKMKYSDIDLILDVYRNHSSIEETIMISAYALQNSGYNVTVASVEHTFHQMMNRALQTGGDQTPGLYCSLLFVMLQKAHQDGPNSDCFEHYDNLTAINL